MYFYLLNNFAIVLDTTLHFSTNVFGLSHSSHINTIIPPTHFLFPLISLKK